MKLNSKSISSPARTEKFPPPLMRFLRTNAASRSRKSKSSPIFVLRKKNNTIETTQEPSSPKVTCMGQVRAKRSSSKSKQKQKLPIWSIKKPNLCRCPRPIWPKWNFFKRKPTTKQHKQDSVKSESNSTNFQLQEEEERVSVSVIVDNNAFTTTSNSFSNYVTPPKNALLLTRCRSAPYRSSSLASKFWSSPLRNEETESTKSESVSDKEDLQGERISESRDLENGEEFLLKGREVKEEDESTVAVAVARPVLLTRCKSEPARIGCRIEPEVNNLWTKTRLGFTVNSSPKHILSD